MNLESVTSELNDGLIDSSASLASDQPLLKDRGVRVSTEAIVQGNRRSPSTAVGQFMHSVSPLPYVVALSVGVGSLVLLSAVSSKRGG